MTTTIYLIRHGEVYNPKDILYSRLPNFGLSETGKKEIKQTAEFLKNKQIDVIYSSPLQRAEETAEIIRAKLKLPVIEHSQSLLEVRTSYQGDLFANLSPDQREVYFSPKSPTDETIEQLAIRMHKIINKLVKRHPGKRIAVIGHGDPIMALRAVIHRLPVTFPSIRTNKYYTYIRHGEVLELEVTDNGTLSEKSVFQPKI